ncbi:putative transporter YcbK [Marinithermofilum abyssi]|uniref:Putative transporter YcbK n=1 Tax=Marinithermofilum abyssi TaxID=1571185 RepID=A0A8J2VG32_9BACL|nr:DMT family transporter [Marinithermofilum abyssi]GGE13877.1 putative transporter YcbK [Marinithermofilum abyssi]
MKRISDTSEGWTYQAGIIMAVLGAVLTSLKAVFMKCLLNDGVSPIDIVFWRMVLAVPLLWMVYLLCRSRLQSAGSSGAKDLFIVVIAGLAGFFASPLLDIFGLESTSVSLERILLFSYPVFVFLAEITLGKRRATWMESLLVLLVMTGVFLTIGGFHPAVFRSNGYGSALIIAASLLFALYLLLSQQVIHRVGSIRFTVFSETVATVALIGFEGYRVGTGTPFPRYDMNVYIWITVIAIFSTVLPFFLLAEGIKRIGAGSVSMIGAVGPVSVTLLDPLFFKESLSGSQWMGCILIIACIYLLERNRASARKGPEAVPFQKEVSRSS